MTAPLDPDYAVMPRWRSPATEADSTIAPDGARPMPAVIASPGA